MRQVLRVLGTRYGVALVMLVLVLAVVGAFRAAAGTSGGDPVAPALEPARTVSAEPGGGDDGVASEEPGAPGSSSSGVAGSPRASARSSSDPDVGSPDEDPASVDNQPAGPPAAQASGVASQFVGAWLKHTGVTGDQWRAGLTPHSTKNLMDKLAETDPVTVPADRATGAVQLIVRDPGLTEASIPLDNGTLRLRLIPVSGQWKVDAISWDRPI